MKHYDAIVVGGGIIGKGIALAMAGEGWETVCIDAEGKGTGVATTAAGAMLGVYGEITAEKAGPIDDAEFELRRNAAALYQGWVDAIEALSGRRVRRGMGTFIIANPAGGLDRANLDAIKALAARHGDALENVEPRDVPGLQPNRQFSATGAVFLPGEGYVHSLDLMEAITAAVQNHEHGEVLNDTVTSVRIENNRAIGVITEGHGAISADVVILAAGIGIPKIVEESLGLAEVVPPMVGGKGVSLVIESKVQLEHVIRTPNRDFACGTHLVPRGGTLTYVGATNRIGDTPGSESGVSAGEVHSLLASAIEEVNTDIRTASVVSQTFGSRPVTFDRYPVIGETGIGGLFLATGTYRNGVLMAPAISNYIKDAICNKTDAIPDYFGPRLRAANPVATSQDLDTAITQGVRDLVSFIQEPRGWLPYNRTEELRNFVEVLLKMTLRPNPELDALRAECVDLLERFPIPEVVPRLFYDFNERMSQESGTVHARY